VLPHVALYRPDGASSGHAQSAFHAVAAEVAAVVATLGIQYGRSQQSLGLDYWGQVIDREDTYQQEQDKVKRDGPVAVPLASRMASWGVRLPRLLSLSLIPSMRLFSRKSNTVLASV